MHRTATLNTNICTFFSSIKKKNKCKEWFQLLCFHYLNNSRHCQNPFVDSPPMKMTFQSCSHLCHFKCSEQNKTIKLIFSSSTQNTQIAFFTQTLTRLYLGLNQIGNKLMNELDQLIERNRRNAKSWTIEMRLALKTVTEWRFFFSISASLCSFNE